MKPSEIQPLFGEKIARANVSPHPYILSHMYTSAGLPRHSAGQVHSEV